MTSYKFGDVVLIHFPQSGSTARKQRPGIVVLDIGDDDLVIVPVTSQVRSQAGDVSILNQPETGLIRPSWMRLAKVSTLLKSDIVRTLGRLPENDRSQLASIWGSLYGNFMT
jgi:mRNA interferase MazF